MKICVTMKTDNITFTHHPQKNLSEVKVEMAGMASMSFTRYVRYIVFEKGRHLEPQIFSAGGHLTVQNLALKFRVTQGKWITFGRLSLAFYSKNKQQVRAKLAFQAAPFGRSTTMHDQCEISWLLSETHIVLPALIESIGIMDWKPLIETGLFTTSDRLSESPDRGCYAWTAAGMAAV